MKKILSALLVAAMSMVFNCFAYADTAILPAGTPVQIQLVKSISANDLNSGDRINFVVKNNVYNGSELAIAQGTEVVGIVKRLKKQGRIGKSGQIIISDFSTKLVNGNYTHLAGDVFDKADSKTALSIVLSAAVIPLFLLMKGKDLVIEPGYETLLYTTSDVKYN